jgi:hypothetical protein
MEWSQKIELSYRVFARQHEDTSLRFNQMRADLTERYKRDVSFSKVFEAYWLCPAEDIEQARSKGFLLLDSQTDEHLRLVVRELPIVISIASEKPTTGAVGELLEKFGNVFASLRIVREALTELQAV